MPTFDYSLFQAFQHELPETERVKVSDIPPEKLTAIQSLLAGQQFDSIVDYQAAILRHYIPAERSIKRVHPPRSPQAKRPRNRRVDKHAVLKKIAKQEGLSEDKIHREPQDKHDYHTGFPPNQYNPNTVAPPTPSGLPGMPPDMGKIPAGLTLGDYRDVVSESQKYQEDLREWVGLETLGFHIEAAVEAADRKATMEAEQKAAKAARELKYRLHATQHGVKKLTPPEKKFKRQVRYILHRVSTGKLYARAALQKIMQKTGCSWEQAEQAIRNLPPA